MRYMVMCFPANQRVYELATPRVFPTLAAAEAYRLSIVPGWRQPITVAVVRPDDAEDVWFNQHGAEFLFLFEYEDKAMGTCVWLLDEDGYEVGIPKAAFLAHFRQQPCSDCDGTGQTCGGHWKCSTCGATGRVKMEDGA